MTSSPQPSAISLAAATALEPAGMTYGSSKSSFARSWSLPYSVAVPVATSPLTERDGVEHSKVPRHTVREAPVSGSSASR